MRERHLVDRRVALQAGVVDEDVDGPELLDGAAEHVRDFRFHGDVGAQRQRSAARPRDVVGDLDRLVLAVPVVDDDIGARLAERDGDGLADSRIRAGDERLLSSERPVLSHGFLHFGSSQLVAPVPRTLHGMRA